MVYVVLDDLIPESNQWSVLIHHFGSLAGKYTGTISILVSQGNKLFDLLSGLELYFTHTYTHTNSGNGRLSSVAAIVGFIVMMSLDVGLG